MTWVRIENKKIVQTIEHPTSSMPVWVEELIYEDVEVTDEAGLVVGIRQEPTNRTHVVESTVSLPVGWEVDPDQMHTWGWTEVEERGKADDKDPGEIKLVNGNPRREWTSRPAPPAPPAPPTLDEVADGQTADVMVALRVIAEEVRGLKAKIR